MSNPSSTGASAPTARRQVPRRFEDYIAHWTPLGRTHCQCCGREDMNCWRTDTPNPTVECEACARKAHAVDVEEENIAFATFDSIVKGLREVAVPLELIRAAALQAIEDAERRDREGFESMLGRLDGKHA